MADTVAFEASSVRDCAVIELPRTAGPAGTVTPVAPGVDVPFRVARVYYLYNVPGGETRGGHAHRALRQLIVAAHGSFDVVIDDGAERRIVTLNRSFQGLLLVPGIWRELINFSSGSVSLVLASLPYDEADYVRDYETFLRMKRG